MNTGQASLAKQQEQQHPISLQLVSTALSPTIVLSICFPLALAHRYQAELLLHLVNFLNGHSSFPFYISVTSKSLTVESLTFLYSLAVGESQSLEKTSGGWRHVVVVPNQSGKLQLLSNLAQQAYNKLITLSQEHQIRESVLAKESQLSSLLVSQPKLIEQLNSDMNQLTCQLLAVLPTNQQVQRSPSKQQVPTVKKEEKRYPVCEGCAKGNQCQEKDTSCEQQLVRKDQKAGLRSAKPVLPEIERPDGE